MMLTLEALSHFLVDALCAATVFGPVKASAADLPMLILLYNTLAFSTQCFVGLAADRVKKHAWAAALSLLAVALGYVLPLPPLARICLVGAGNSVFHVAGGVLTLEGSRGRAGPLGVFVAPGAVGLVCGTLRPEAGPVFAALAVLAAAATVPLAVRFPICPEDAGELPRPRKGMVGAVILLTLAVAVRAVGGSVVAFPWKTGAVLSLLLALFVWTGKTAGGFLCDRIGPNKTAALSILPAALLISFCSRWMLPSLAGQLALNLTMPVTLWLLYRAMPDAPGFAFGLAAAALWPGTLAGQLITLTGPWKPGLMTAAFLFGLGAILYSGRRILSGSDPLTIRKENESK